MKAWLDKIVTEALESLWYKENQEE